MNLAKKVEECDLADKANLQLIITLPFPSLIKSIKEKEKEKD